MRSRVARAETLEKVSNIDDVTGTTLDNAPGLNALAEVTKEEAEVLIEKAKAGEKLTAKNIRKAHKALAVEISGAAKSGTPNKSFEAAKAWRDHGAYIERLSDEQLAQSPIPRMLKELREYMHAMTS